MESLWNEVQNLKATMKQWEIVTLNKSGREFPFDSKYSSWNFQVLNGKLYNGDLEVSINNNSYYVAGASFGTVSYSKSGNTIVGNNHYGNVSQITVLFYK